ncbi:hypothetical protein [Thalassoglobus sp.]|uniref:hypothetical protein n=1 Tax=Thalassoglobus sp. TaxID=2795869 RepID=UPI003AA8A27E
MLNKQLLICFILTLGMATGCAKKSETTAEGEPATTDEAAAVELGEAAPPELSAEDKALVEAQVFCPVGGELGGMGTPVKVMVDGQPIFICCEGCRGPLLEDPEKYLAELEEKKKKAAEKEAEASEDAETEKATS